MGEEGDKIQQAITILTAVAQSQQSQPQSQPQGSRQRATGSCNRALAAVRSIRERLGSTSEVAREQRSNFSPYGSSNKGKKPRSWTTKFFCLSNRDSLKVPCGLQERDDLVQAGLGEKKVVIPDIDCSQKEFYDVLIKTFPKLQGIGGFDLLRCIPNSKELEPLSTTVSQSPKLLKSVLGNGRIFIRPIQRNIDLDIDEGLASSADVIKEKCIHCGTEIPIRDLRKHVRGCKFERMKFDSSSDSDFEPISAKQSCTRPVRVVLSSSSDENDVTETENAILDHVIVISSETNDQPSPVIAPRTLRDIVKKLSQSISDKEVVLPVRRDHVLDDALLSVKRKSFPHSYFLKVAFIGEAAQDGGGPGREFWSLLSKEIKNSLFEGVDNCCVLRHDAVGLQARKFFFVGNLMAMGFVQGCSGFPFMAPPVYEYLCGKDISTICVKKTDVPNCEVQLLLKKIEEAANDGDLQKICLQDIDMILDAGYSKPITTITSLGVDELVSTLTCHYTLYKNKAVLDQLKSGLNILGVYDAMHSHSDIIESFFVCGKQPPLTGAVIKDLLQTVHYSEPGSSQRIREEATYMLFLDFVYDLEENEANGVSLGHLLSFFTGADYPPPMGFHVKPELRFNGSNDFPTASTCALQLTLPTKHQASQFKQKMIYALLNHGGFGAL